jgi:hypothetical protein
MLFIRFVMVSNSRKGFQRISVFIIVFGRCGSLSAVTATGAGIRSLFAWVDQRAPAYINTKQSPLKPLNGVKSEALRLST